MKPIYPNSTEINAAQVVKGIITDDYCHFVTPLAAGKGIRWFKISSLGLRQVNSQT